ncbi:uncharacterized protein LOC127285083 [Leptopilina boulardi]|uniref:uncharacterized protein LOC127285083 n=1 Tax=Leptopilina boulardi TaxID=63433 RepID=UPI0021F5F54D|nr:uncharacterized protein LOC127285083 [Leptopilina boulardi]
MKFILCYFLYFCVFYAWGDPILEFKTILEETAKTIAEYEHEFFNSIIVVVSNLKDTSTEALGESWNATLISTEILNVKADTKEKKDCIEVESKKLIEIINSVAFTLDSCRENSSATSQPIRTKIQDIHKACMSMENELDTIRSSCSQDVEKSEECISYKVNELRVSLKNILEQLQTYMIDAGTIKPQILSNAMNCNAKILKEVYEQVINIQQNLEKCV